ncbi:MAG: response regulator [Bacteroidales bacterium]
MNTPANILIVDDNPKNLQVLGKILKDNHYSIEFAMNGQIALEWISARQFDLVLLDINMPGMDGFEVCNRIRSDQQYHQIPIIFLSAETSRESILKGFEVGAQDYVTKPFDSRELLARVRTHIELKKNRDEISEFSDLLKTKNKLITHSIHYALQIQKAVRNSTHKASSDFSSTFSLLLPRDIVSGDFEWFYRHNDSLLAGVFDCTGHGVPGALMSILGITLLNETVDHEGCHQPNLILDNLRNKIIDALGQKGSMDEVKDGMDGAMISYDPKNRILGYAGANSSSLLIRNGNVIELKGDRMPVSYYERQDKFSIQKIPLMDNDILYLFSDGYPDQFGGPSDKKFGLRRLRELLTDCHKYSMEDQKRILYDTLMDWKGDRDQIDDVIVVGLKF